MAKKETQSPNRDKKKKWWGKPKVQFEKDPYSAYQNFLYRRAIYGLDIYTAYEIQDMDKGTHDRIIAHFNKTQMVLNKWKQKIIIDMSVDFFKRMFPKQTHTCEFVEALKKPCKPDPFLKNNLTFKDLGISKDMIIEKLISSSLLPSNFHTLTTENLKARSFSKPTTKEHAN